MLRSLQKAAESLERNLDTAFSTGAGDDGGYAHREYDINGQRVKLGPVFASGGFSFVHSARPAGTRPTCTTRYAVKRMAVSDSEGLAMAKREIDVLNAVPPHRNIVKFLGARMQPPVALLLFELVDGGTLHDVLQRKKGAVLAVPEILGVFHDSVAAVAHLHSQSPPIACRDVKLENLLYDRIGGVFKLCDLGSCTSVAQRHVTRQQILAAEDDIASNCSAMYRAPEMVDLYTKQFICERVDVWALGCIFFALLYGELPFDGTSSMPILKAAYEKPPGAKEYPESFDKLLEAMLRADPAERADVFTVLEVVCRLRNQEMDPGLRACGFRLREQRARDFGSSASAPAAASSSSNGGLGPRPVQPPVEDFFAAPAAAPAPVPARNAFAASQSAAADDGSGWADFDSAFDEPAAQPTAPAPLQPTAPAPARPSLPKAAKSRQPRSVADVLNRITTPTSALSKMKASLPKVSLPKSSSSAPRHAGPSGMLSPMQALSSAEGTTPSSIMGGGFDLSALYGNIGNNIGIISSNISNMGKAEDKGSPTAAAMAPPARNSALSGGTGTPTTVLSGNKEVDWSSLYAPVEEVPEGGEPKATETEPMQAASASGATASQIPAAKGKIDLSSLYAAAKPVPPAQAGTQASTAPVHPVSQKAATNGNGMMDLSSLYASKGPSAAQQGAGPNTSGQTGAPAQAPAQASNVPLQPVTQKPPSNGNGMMDLSSLYASKGPSAPQQGAVPTSSGEAHLPQSAAQPAYTASAPLQPASHKPLSGGGLDLGSLYASAGSIQPMAANPAPAANPASNPTPPLQSSLNGAGPGGSAPGIPPQPPSYGVRPGSQALDLQDLFGNTGSAGAPDAGVASAPSKAGPNVPDPSDEDAFADLSGLMMMGLGGTKK